MLKINHDQKPVINLEPGGNSSIDIEAIIEQIWTDLRGTASRSEIKRIVIEVAPRYADARIFTYIPIFMGKEVRRRLLGTVWSFQWAETSTDPKTGKTNLKSVCIHLSRLIKGDFRPTTKQIRSWWTRQDNRSKFNTLESGHMRRIGRCQQARAGGTQVPPQVCTAVDLGWEPALKPCHSGRSEGSPSLEWRFFTSLRSVQNDIAIFIRQALTSTNR